MLQTSSRSRGKNSSQVLQGENTKQAKSRPKQRKLKCQEQQTKKNTPGQEEPQPTAEIDPEMPPLEDITPKKKFRFKVPDSIPWSKHFSN